MGAPGPGTLTATIVTLQVKSPTGEVVASYGGTSSFDIYDFTGSVKTATLVDSLNANNGIYFAHGSFQATLADTANGALADGGYPTGTISATW